MYMIFLGIDETDPDKPILESKAGLLQIKPGAIIKIKNKLYQVKTMRQKTRSSMGQSTVSRAKDKNKR